MSNDGKAVGLGLIRHVISGWTSHYVVTRPIEIALEQQGPVVQFAGGDGFI